MADLGRVFDQATVVDEGFDGAPLPVDDYVLSLTKSEAKFKEDGKTIKGVNMEYTVLSEKFNGRKVFEYLNIGHDTLQVRQIADATLKRLSLAVGQTAPFSETSVLHDRPFVARVKVTEPQNGYPAGNKIVSYKPMSGVAGSIAPTAQAPASNKPPVAAGHVPPPFVRNAQAARTGTNG